MRKHKFIIIPRDKVIMGGPMNVFIRCKNKGCIAGIDLASLEEPGTLLKQWKKIAPNNCPYSFNYDQK